jgi:hypothetical protein
MRITMCNRVVIRVGRSGIEADQRSHIRATTILRLKKASLS